MKELIKVKYGKKGCKTGYEPLINRQFRLFALFGAGSNFCIDLDKHENIEKFREEVLDLNECKLINWCNSHNRWTWWSDITGYPEDRKWHVKGLKDE